MALYTPEYKPTGKEVAIIKTSQGTIQVELDGEGAPSTLAISSNSRKRASTII